MLSLGGLPILGRILNRPSLLTRTKAFVRSIKAAKRVLLGIQNYIVTEQYNAVWKIFKDKDHNALHYRKNQPL